MQGYGPASSSLSSSSHNLTRSSSFDFGGSDLLGGGPLSQLADSVNSLDPLSSMEKTINDSVVGMPAPNHHPHSHRNSNSDQNQPHTPQTGPHTPHTPHTPHNGQVHTPAGSCGPPSVGYQHNSHNTSPPNNNNHNNSSNSECIPDTTTSESGLPSDLNFDPEAVINGEGSGNESLNVSESLRNFKKLGFCENWTNF